MRFVRSALDSLDFGNRPRFLSANLMRQVDLSAPRCAHSTLPVIVLQGRPGDTPWSRLQNDGGMPARKEARPVAPNIPPAHEIALHQQLEETDRGLVYDLSTLIDRRQVL